MKMDDTTVVEEEELVFILVDEHQQSKIAVEGRYGIVAVGDSLAELQAAIIDKVQEHFQGKYEGKIRIRQFADTVISM